MANQRETNSYKNQVDELTEALATARKMQEDWLNYGINFIHIYVDDADGDWLETWGDEEIFTSSLLDKIKEFLVSDDIVALRLRRHLGDRSLFEIAVNLEECWQIYSADERLTAVKHLLADDKTSDIAIFDLANSLIQKLSAVL
ncbi:hypothetical protein [Anabaena subtropica]|uniref:Uncharacterized protein n=1 Tax=Anabaena subtropica FACHB-260 TaxID=2692884 RepID=A0ABR8CT84_9NOST|nr:hypothetical protein [Anabaena subtropica]MBD2346411.1 hypothetical protein [Anabaena subtropica FACHB-260]